jgi:hypothetical protein
MKAFALERESLWLNVCIVKRKREVHLFKTAFLHLPMPEESHGELRLQENWTLRITGRGRVDISRSGGTGMLIRNCEETGQSYCMRLVLLQEAAYSRWSNR